MSSDVALIDGVLPLLLGWSWVPVVDREKRNVKYALPLNAEVIFY